MDVPIHFHVRNWQDAAHCLGCLDGHVIIHPLKTTLKRRLCSPDLFNDDGAKHAGCLKKDAGGVKCFCGLKLDVAVLKIVSADLYSPGDDGLAVAEHYLRGRLFSVAGNNGDR